MKVFELSVGDEMGESRWLFTHDSKSPEGFKADCYGAIHAVADKVIANESFHVSVYDWLEAIIPELEAGGYTHIYPDTVSFRTESLNSVDDDSKWCEVVGKATYEKAVKAGFKKMVDYSANTDYFLATGEVVYHSGDCSVLQSMWRKQIWDFPKESFAKKAFERYAPCQVCLPDVEKVEVK